MDTGNKRERKDSKENTRTEKKGRMREKMINIKKKKENREKHHHCTKGEKKVYMKPSQIFMNTRNKRK